VAEGYKVVDVRDERQYEKAHIKDSEHIPLFVENKDMDPGTFLTTRVLVLPSLLAQVLCWKERATGRSTTALH
jgi:hypothetical protein